MADRCGMCNGEMDHPATFSPIHLSHDQCVCELRQQLADLTLRVEQMEQREEVAIEALEHSAQAYNTLRLRVEALEEREVGEVDESECRCRARWFALDESLRTDEPYHDVYCEAKPVRTASPIVPMLPPGSRF